MIWCSYAELELRHINSKFCEKALFKKRQTNRSRLAAFHITTNRFKYFLKIRCSSQEPVTATKAKLGYAPAINEAVIGTVARIFNGIGVSIK